MRPGLKIIDFHTHLGDLLYGEPLEEAYEYAYWTFESISEWTGFRLNKPAPGFKTLARYLEIFHAHQRNNMATLKNLRRFSLEAGISRSIILPIEPIRKSEDNLKVCQEANLSSNQTGHKIFSFASVAPRDPERIQKLHRYLASGCLGLKIHPIIQNLPLTDPAWFEICEEFGRYQKPILIHSGVSHYYIPYFKRSEYGNAASYEKLIAAFPKQVFILGHCNLTKPETAWSLGRKYPNVYADMSFQSASNIRKSFRQLGADRVLFASDFPFSIPKYSVRVGLKATANSASQRDNFFFGNAARLLGKLD